MKFNLSVFFLNDLSVIHLNFYAGGSLEFFFGGVVKKQNHLLSLMVSEGQELGSGLCGQFWLRVSYEELSVVWGCNHLKT